MIGMAGILLAGTVLLAKPGVIVTRDGQRLEGDISARGDDVVVSIRGIETVVPRSNIASINYAEPFEKEFQDRLAKLDAKDVKGRIDLARWAFDQKQYVAARDACEAALAIDPNNREATDLENLVRGQMRLEHVRANPAAPTRPSVEKPPRPTNNAAGARLLTPADINTIRQWELRPSDTRVTVRLENGVERRYVQFANLQYSEFNAKAPVDRAIDILDRGDPSMRKDVKILSDPTSLIDFKAQVQPMVLNGCATSNCHGGNKAGSLQLLTPASSDAVTYTNFYILTEYHKKTSDPTGGVFEGNVDRRLVDRGHGADSLLVQYMLPPEVSKFDHPKVAGFNGLARGRDDVKIRQVINWMDKSLSGIAPNYGIDYEIPGASTTQPEPATQPTRQ
jgi:hypothetical protein